MTKPALRVQPLADGCAPLLAPGLFCRDDFRRSDFSPRVGLWHFCDPDGAVWALHPEQVIESAQGVTITKAGQAASVKLAGVARTTRWTLRNSRWETANE
jgi:hypothetical protein